MTENRQVKQVLTNIDRRLEGIDGTSGVITYLNNLSREKNLIQGETITSLRRIGYQFIHIARILDGLPTLSPSEGDNIEEEKNKFVQNVFNTVNSYADAYAKNSNITTQEALEKMLPHLGLNIVITEIPTYGNCVAISFSEKGPVGQEEPKPIVLTSILKDINQETVDIYNVNIDEMDERKINPYIQRAIYRYAKTHISSMNNEALSEWFTYAQSLATFHGQREDDRVSYTPDTAYAKAAIDQSIRKAKASREKLWQKTKSAENVLKSLQENEIKRPYGYTSEEEVIAIAHDVLVLSLRDRERMGINIMVRTSPRLEKMMQMLPRDINMPSINSVYITFPMGGTPHYLLMTVRDIARAFTPGNDTLESLPDDESVKRVNEYIKANASINTNATPAEELNNIAYGLKSLDSVIKGRHKMPHLIGLDEIENKRKAPTFAGRRSKDADTLNQLKSLFIYNYLSLASEIEKEQPNLSPIFKIYDHNEYGYNRHIQIRIHTLGMIMGGIVFPERYGDLYKDPIHFNKEFDVVTNLVAMAERANRLPNGIDADLLKLLQKLFADPVHSSLEE